MLPNSLSRLLLALLLLVPLRGYAQDAPSTPEQTVQPTEDPAASPSPATQSLPEIPEYRPYNVSIRVALPRELTAIPSSTERLLQSIEGANLRYWGNCWSLTLRQENILQPGDALRLRDLTPEECIPLDSTPHLDKLFLVCVEDAGIGWKVSGREFDRRSRLLTSVRSQETADLRELPDVVARICAELFRPIIIIEDVAGKNVYVRLLGGALVPPDADLLMARPGSLWLPLSRSIPSRDAPQERVQLVPWTYLRMEAPPTLEQSVCRCDLITGIKNPIPARRSRRVESLALAINPDATPTTIKLVSRSAVKVPLPAYDVDVMSAEKQLQTTLLTDRKGRVNITGSPSSPLQWIQVRSGQLKLAQLPLVSGVLPETELEVPSDSARLRVEASLAVIQTRLMELVVERALLMRHLKRVTDEGKWDQVDVIAKELQALPDREVLKSEVRAIRVSESKAAEEIKDRLGARRIEKLCDETLDLIDRHMSDDKVKDLIAISQELKTKEIKAVREIEENPEAGLKQLKPAQ